MSDNRTAWVILGLVLAGAFSILGFFGREVYRQAPPIPERVTTTDGRVLWTREDILTGKQAWQSMGGQQVGSIWGHGAYQAPDWSADWLHREALSLREALARKTAGDAYDTLTPDRQAGVDALLVAEMRRNTWDEASGTVTVSPERAAAIEETAAHYVALFGDDSALTPLRESYALQEEPGPLLPGRGLVEPGRRGPVRLPDQSAHHAVLHTGPRHHARPWSRGPLRRVWPARAGPAPWSTSSSA